MTNGLLTKIDKLRWRNPQRSSRERLNSFLTAVLTIAALAMGHTAWAQVSGTGTESDPYVVTTWGDLKTAFDNASTDASAPTTITLDADVTASNGDSYLNLSGGRHVVLDLNGHRIDRNLTTATENGYVIRLTGSTTSLTIRDGATGGTITGGYNTAGAGCISVSNATLRIERGTISGNRVARQGGAISTSGTVHITGGTITDNWVNIEETGNNSITACGAIYFTGGTLYMSGGAITGNRCRTTTCGSAGIGADPLTGVTSHVHLSGSYNISGNLQGDYDGSAWSNLTASDILNTSRITYDLDDAISPTAPARMILDQGGNYGTWKETFTSGWATYMREADPETCFILTDPNGNGIGIVGGEAHIGTLHTVSLATGLTASAAQAAQGKPVNLSGAAPRASRYVVTYNDGEAHTDYYTADANGNATFLMPDANVSVSSENLPEIAYIDADGSTKYCTNFTVIQSSNSHVILGGGNNDEAWYVVGGEVTISGNLHFSDQSPRLILMDGATLTVANSDDAISCYRTLAIYGQSGGTGRLVATSTSGRAIVSNSLTINGGIVSATSQTAQGIQAGSITINGGSVTAETQASYNYSLNANNITINGGNVSASGGYGIFADNTITLGWSNVDDRITISQYRNGTVTIKDGQSFWNGSETLSGNITDMSKLNGKTLQPFKAINLTDDATEIGAWNGGVADVTLSRTFPAGKKQTVCLPFDPSALLSLGTVWAFTGISEDKAVMTQQTGSLVANTPYIFEATTEVTSTTFSEVAISVGSDPKTDNGALVFHGTYAQKTWEADAAVAANIYGFMLADNDGQQVGQFVKARRRTILRPFSCWLEKTTDGALSGTQNAAARGLTRGIDGEPDVIGIIWRSATGETTGIGSFNLRTGEIIDGSDEWYSLDGRRLSGKPSTKGLYIHNGRKVVLH